MTFCLSVATFQLKNPNVFLYLNFFLFYIVIKIYFFNLLADDNVCPEPQKSLSNHRETGAKQQLQPKLPEKIHSTNALNGSAQKYTPGMLYFV